MTAKVRLFAAAVVSVLAFAPIGARADALAVDFEGPTYVPGSVHGQDGWSSAGSAGSGCAPYDHALVPNTYGYASFGAQSLRISNAVTSGCFGDQTFSKSLANEAGEDDAEVSPLAGGVRVPVFTASWDFASTVPGSEQPGLSVVASADRGDGARMSWIQMADGADGLAVNFFDYQADAGGTCANGLNFVFTPVVSGLDRTRVHTIATRMILLDGPGNDIVEVYVDGALEHTGTSWEDFFRECQPVGGTDAISRTVDSILFRTAGAPAPGTLGGGFVIDNLSTASSLVATSVAAEPAVLETAGPQLNLLTLRATLTSELGALAGAPVTFTAGSTTLCTATTDAGGTATCDALGSAVDVVLAAGYTASFAGDADHAASSDAAGLIE